MKSVPDKPADTDGLLYWAGFLSLLAGVIHAMAAPGHWQAWWGYGTFFLLAAVGQILYGALLLLQPWRYDTTGGWRNRTSADPIAQRVYALGVTGNTAIIFLYVLTRTIGIPIFGPGAGEVEPVTVLSLLSKIVELGLIVTLLVMIRRASAEAMRETAKLNNLI